MLLMDERNHRHRATARIVDELMALKAESVGSAEGQTHGREGRRQGGTDDYRPLPVKR
jgi:hypothetical protein